MGKSGRGITINTTRSGKWSQSDKHNKYNLRALISTADIQQIKHALVQLGAERFGLSEDQVQAWGRWYNGVRDFEGCRFLLPWTQRGGGYQPSVMRSEKLAGDIQSPWIEVRDDVQISIKLLPKEPVDIRIAVAKAIKDTLGPKAEIFDYYPGGYASLDLNPRGVNKAVALKDLILEFVLQNHVVLYFGDEFYRKVDAQGKLQKLGNDISVLDVDGIIPVAVNESITPPVQTEAQRIKWIGSGPTATHEFILELRKRVERFLKPDNEQLAAIIKEDEVFQNAL